MYTLTHILLVDSSVINSSKFNTDMDTNYVSYRAGDITEEPLIKVYIHRARPKAKVFFNL